MAVNQRQPQTWTTTQSGGGQVVSHSQPQGYYYGGGCPGCPTAYYNGLDQRERCRRLAAFILGIFAALFLFIAMAENEPSERSYLKCGWTEVYGYSYYYGYYGSLDYRGDITYTDACEHTQSACAAVAGGLIAVLCLLAAWITCVCAVIWVNPFCVVNQGKCGACYGKLFIATLILSVIAVVAWFALSGTFCMSNEYLNLEVGTSMVQSILAAVLVAIAIGVLYIK
eukprot:256703_1